MSRSSHRIEDEDDLDRNDRTVRRSRRKKSGSRAPGMLLGVLGGVILLVNALNSERAQDKSQPDELQRNRERLIGKWTALVQERPRREFTYEFRADGTFVLILRDGAGRQVTSTGTWKALSAR